MNYKVILESRIFLVFAIFAILLVIYGIYRIFRRIEAIADLPRNPKGYKFRGVVTHVGDGDGFSYSMASFI